MRLSLENMYQQVLAAFAANSPDETLRAVISDLLRNGEDRERIIAQIDSVRINKFGNDEERSDVLLDVLDTLTGWCAPERRL